MALSRANTAPLAFNEVPASCVAQAAMMLLVRADRSGSEAA
eukprot:CAMPEP_0173250896 /NCGR_PEP_ID=MMETSP1142-20121109/19841_1 /TAXON_ID=483371 /ORGANISM="non described non described, Strain CCMP2298" /LENGTH=40 /DNA_ID= /DNA_START= /DNA_END= /DNA_ORIENTATION=